MERSIIVALDPGTTTGVATLTDGVFDSFEVDEVGLYEWIDAHCEDMAHLQVEQFVINASTVRKTIVYDSLYLIGFLRYAAWRCLIPVTAYTKPADVMQTFPDSALKRVGWHTPGRGHSNDAARHLAYFAVRTGKMSGALFLPK